MTSDIYLTGGPATSVRMEERAQSALVTLENSGQYSAYCKSKVVSRVVVIIVVVSN